MIKHKTTSQPDITISVTNTEERRNSDNLLLSSFGAGSRTYTPYIADIVYTTRPKSQRQQANWCRHTVTRTRYELDPSYTPVLNWASHGSHFNVHHETLKAFDYHTSAIGAVDVLFGVNTGTALLGANAQGLINDGATRLRPDLTTFSLPNDLLDVGQIPDLIKLWKKNQSVVKNLAGAHLNYAFGWRPTIGDIQAALSGVTSFVDKLAEFRKLVGTLVSKRATVLNNSIDVSGSNAFGDTNGGVTAYSGHLQQEVAAHVVYAPMMPLVLGNIDIVLRGLLDTLGFELNPRIIWDKIPFTFVIDWFFSVGSFLEQFKLDTLELPIQYIDSYLQYTEVKEYKSKMSSSLVGDQTFSASYGQNSTLVRFFQRYPIFPDYATLAGLHWKKPTLTKAALATSLLIVLGKNLPFGFSQARD